MGWNSLERTAEHPIFAGLEGKDVYFTHSFAMNAGACVHLETLYGDNSHHIAESGFKALARALRMAVELDPKTHGHAPSTKGVL